MQMGDKKDMGMGSNISMDAVTVTVPVGSHIRVAVTNYMEENTKYNPAK